MCNDKLSKRFWAVLGIVNSVVVFYLISQAQPETNDARALTAAMLAGALLTVVVIDLITVAIASSRGGIGQRSIRHS